MIKKIALYSVLATCVGITNAHSNGAIYANGVSANNITAIQHSIVDAALHHSYAPTFSVPAAPVRKQPDTDIYGHAPTYGTMPTYGEYGDDGTVFIRGRNGGDTAAPHKNIWTTWRHYNDDAKPGHYSLTDSDYNIVMIGGTVADIKTNTGVANFGIYAGYVGGNQRNSTINIDENGGYFGIYGGNTIKNFNISATVNAGALYNTTHKMPTPNEYANMWFGTGVQATYTIALGDTLSLQPTLYAGYTWINSANYTLAPDTHVANHNFNAFELTPGIRATKHMVDGWIGTIGVKYVANYAHGGDIHVNGDDFGRLDIRNYTEYNLGLEKTVAGFHISATIGRRDGARSGWHGGLGTKYMF